VRHYAASNETELRLRVVRRWSCVDSTARPRTRRKGRMGVLDRRHVALVRARRRHRVCGGGLDVVLPLDRDGDLAKRRFGLDGSEPGRVCRRSDAADVGQGSSAAAAAVGRPHRRVGWSGSALRSWLRGPHRYRDERPRRDHRSEAGHQLRSSTSRGRTVAELRVVPPGSDRSTARSDPRSAAVSAWASLRRRRRASGGHRPGGRGIGVDSCHRDDPLGGSAPMGWARPGRQSSKITQHDLT
jgi:hypothetical protein